MSTPAANLPFPVKKPVFNQVVIAGKIDFSRREKVKGGEPFFITLVRTPAHDQYSMPGMVEIISDKPIGQRGEEIQQLCWTHGIPNNYDKKEPDKETGEIITVRSARNRLIAIQD